MVAGLNRQLSHAVTHPTSYKFSAGLNSLMVRDGVKWLLGLIDNFLMPSHTLQATNYEIDFLV